MAERTRSRRSAVSTRRGSSSRSQNAGGRLNRDYSGEEYREPSEGYQGEMPTKGLYTAELVSISDHVKQDDPDAQSVKWLFKLAEGSENKHGDDVSGYADSVYTTENTLWREQQILVALGIIKPGGKCNLTYEQIIKKAKPCTVRVDMERYIPEDGDAEWRARFGAFLPLRDTKPTRRAKDEDPEDEEDFDAEDDADEEDEEDEPPARSRRSRRKAEPEPEDEDDEDDEDEEGDEDDEEEPYDPDELAAELADLSLAKLKARARDEFKVKIKRGMTADDIIDEVLATLDEPPEDDEDEEPEDEPEPPRRSRRGASKSSSRSATRKRGSSKEPPF